jgi:hypothetical protein
MKMSVNHNNHTMQSKNWRGPEIRIKRRFFDSGKDGECADSKPKGEASAGVSFVLYSHVVNGLQTLWVSKLRRDYRCKPTPAGFV